MLDITVVDALVAGLSTAFFGALVAGGSYLLTAQMRLREQVVGLERRMGEFTRVEEAASSFARASTGHRFKPSGSQSEGDADE